MKFCMEKTNDSVINDKYYPFKKIISNSDARWLQYIHGSGISQPMDYVLMVIPHTTSKRWGALQSVAWLNCAWRGHDTPTQATNEFLQENNQSLVLTSMICAILWSSDTPYANWCLIVRDVRSPNPLNPFTSERSSHIRYIKIPICAMETNISEMPVETFISDARTLYGHVSLKFPAIYTI